MGFGFLRTATEGNVSDRKLFGKSREWRFQFRGGAGPFPGNARWPGFNFLRLRRHDAVITRKVLGDAK
jgi:hypothetical protein